MTMRYDVSSPIPAEFIQKQVQDQSHDANFALMELEKGISCLFFTYLVVDFLYLQFIKFI